MFTKIITTIILRFWLIIYFPWENGLITKFKKDLLWLFTTTILKVLLFSYFSFEFCLYLSNRGKNSILFSDFSISFFYILYIFWCQGRETEIWIFLFCFEILSQKLQNWKSKHRTKKKFKREFQNIFSSKPLKGVMVRKVVCSFLPNKLQKKMSWKKISFFKI